MVASVVPKNFCGQTFGVCACPIPKSKWRAHEIIELHGLNILFFVAPSSPSRMKKPSNQSHLSGRKL